MTRDQMQQIMLDVELQTWGRPLHDCLEAVALAVVQQIAQDMRQQAGDWQRRFPGPQRIAELEAYAVQLDALLVACAAIRDEP